MWMKPLLLAHRAEIPGLLGHPPRIGVIRHIEKADLPRAHLDEEQHEVLDRAMPSPHLVREDVA